MEKNFVTICLLCINDKLLISTKFSGVYNALFSIPQRVEVIGWTTSSAVCWLKANSLEFVYVTEAAAKFLVRRTFKASEFLVQSNPGVTDPCDE